MRTGSRATPLWTLTPVEEARLAGLIYTQLDAPGYTRKRCRDTFRYFCPKGRPVRAARLIKRFHQLAIPPAWENVWICPLPLGHIQATGFDARGRKQYRYHDIWRSHRDGTKFHRVSDFGLMLPRIRSHVRTCLEKPTLSKSQVTATVVRLLEATLIRIGNEAYARANKSFGLTTIRSRHIAVRRSKIEFHFKGKSGVQHDIALKDPRLARIIAKCQDLPGQLLFQYVDETGEVKPVTSCDINRYLQELTGSPFSAKDFRTWNASVLALQEFARRSPPSSQAEAKRTVKEAAAIVAANLRNTVAVCRKSYIHPGIIEAYCSGELPLLLASLSKTSIERHRRRGLKSSEATFLSFLEVLQLAKLRRAS